MACISNIFPLFPFFVLEYSGLKLLIYVFFWKYTVCGMKNFYYKRKKRGTTPPFSFFRFSWVAEVWASISFITKPIQYAWNQCNFRPPPFIFCPYNQSFLHTFKNLLHSLLIHIACCKNCPTIWGWSPPFIDFIS